MKTNKFAEDAEIIQFSMKGNVFPLVRVIKLKLMEHVRDVIFMTLIVINVFNVLQLFQIVDFVLHNKDVNFVKIILY